MSSTYSDVDASADPSKAVEWQDRVDQWPQVQAYRHRILELLAAARSVLDAGCGPGGDVLAIGRDRCLGLDPSMAMCVTAAARGATVCRGEVHQLPFPDGSWSALVANRVLQHVQDPLRAVAEMVRVIDRGGRLVIADPDQETLVIHVPGVGQDFIDRIKALRRDVGYRNGRLISSLPAALAAVGVSDVSVDPFAVCLTNPDDAFGLPGWPRLWQHAGGFSDDDLLRWERGMTRSRESDGFLYALVYFVVTGVRA
jgi:SAM-dependent methyltransferase